MKYLSESELKKQRMKRMTRVMYGVISDAKTFDELLPDLISNVEYVVKTIIKDKDDQKDFCQDVLIKCLESKEQIESIYTKKGNVKGWLYSFIKNKFLDQQRHENVKNKFHTSQLYNQRQEVKSMIFRDDEELDLPINQVKTFDNMMKELSSTERMWIKQYIESGLNYEDFARRSKISNRKIKERILFILDKWKHLDIYLPR